MTTHMVNGEIKTLKREAVAELRDWHARRAARDWDRQPTRQEREMGEDSQGLYEGAKASKAEAARLTKILECIDTGVSELPRELYPR
jgi:hypothetical protein